MAERYENEILRFMRPDDLQRNYEVGCVVVVDGKDRVHTTSWPEDQKDMSYLRVLLPEEDPSDSEVSSHSAQRLRRHDIDPYLADMIGKLVELGWNFALELYYEDETPVHRASVSAGVGEDWTVLGSGADVDHAEALALALAAALEVMASRRTEPIRLRPR